MEKLSFFVKNGKIFTILIATEQSFSLILHSSLKPEHSAKKEQKAPDIKDNTISFPATIREDTKPLESPKALKEILSLVQNEYSGFREEIKIEDLRSPILVIPQQNNERIIAQHGAFILFGLDERTLKENDLEKHLFGEIKSFEVNASKKSAILKELKTLGIHLHTLLPGIEHCAHYLMDLLEPKEENTPEENFNLGLMYCKGNGVTQDYKKALGYWEKAANKEDALARACLGVIYYCGNGVPQDYQKARELWEKAADQGHPAAQCNLGNMYLYGLGGVPRSPQKAFELWQPLASKGLALAQHNLGVWYRDLNPSSLEKARYWFKKAADQDFQPAIDALKMLDAEEAKDKAQASDKEPPEGDEKPDA
ncbi:sel1 repeat family protein [Acetobacteraceae bacterium]|nr:sel1 repeat family protein [Acetobacteraceae bacterium]